MSNAELWSEVEDHILSEKETLQGFTSHTEIYQWAINNGYNTQELFPIVKAELKKVLDIDYAEMREQSRQELAEKRHLAIEKLSAEAADAPLVELWAAASANGTFAIVSDEDVVWYGTFHEDDFDFVGDLRSALRSVAKKAVWIAGKVREDMKAPAIRLTLHMDDAPGDLGKEMLRNNVAVHLEFDGSGGASEVSTLPGYKSWREIPLDSLVVSQ